MSGSLFWYVNKEIEKFNIGEECFGAGIMVRIKRESDMTCLVLFFGIEK